MDKIIIAGGTGFLGQALDKYFTQQGKTVYILTRNPKADHHHQWNGKDKGPWCSLINGAAAVINLTGRSVDCRYTADNKKEILDSRIDSTKVLDLAISECQDKPKIFINASSATVYVHAENQAMTERAGIIGDDFSMNIVKQWEKVFFENDLPTVRKMALRTSIALGHQGGALPKMKMITRLGLGGQQGNGHQMISWIQVEDFCRAVDHIMQTTYLEGVINVTAPNPIRNKAFMRLLRQKLKPLFYINQPKWLLELGAFFMRTETELILKSRYVVPERLLKSGFKFKYETVEAALAV